MKKNHKPTLVLFCGLPGSGKTTLAKRLDEAGRGIRICTDDWQANLGMNSNPDNFHTKLQKRLYEHALELLNHDQW
jgi:predicted kinase